MGGPLSVTFAKIFLTKLENNVVKPTNPAFYKRFVDDVITKRYVNKDDDLFTKLNNYNNKIIFTCEENPIKFLDTNFSIKNNIMKTSVHRKPNNLHSLENKGSKTLQEKRNKWRFE